MTLHPRRHWTPAELAELRARYPHEPATAIARDMHRGPSGVYAAAHKLGLRKAPEVIAAMARDRAVQPGHGGAGHRWPKGHAPWNKGVPGSTGHHPNSRATQFQPGQYSGRAAELRQPLGTLRVNADGVLERKVTELPGASHLRWKAVHTLVWVAAHGPVPAGHLVVFRPGCKTADPAAITLDRLECISRAENMRRNTVHAKLPPAVARLVQLRGALQRQINRAAAAARQRKEQAQP